MPSSFSRTSREKSVSPCNHHLQLHRNRKSLLKLFRRRLRGSSKLFELLPFQVFLLKTDHVPSRHEIIVSFRIHRSNAGLARLGVEEVAELYQLVPAVFEHDHGAASARDQELHRGIS